MTVQVKASRMFEKCVEEGLHRFWIKLDPKKLEEYARKVDFYIFVFYNTIYHPDSVPTFERAYLVIPTNELIARAHHKKRLGEGLAKLLFRFIS